LPVPVLLRPPGRHMAANARPTPVPGTSGAPGAAGLLPGPPLYASASVSVGGGDWASEVLSNVVGDRGGDKELDATTSAASAPTTTPVSETAEERVRRIVLEKKRLFHSQRALELKNLPEGVTEQVRGGPGASVVAAAAAGGAAPKPEPVLSDCCRARHAASAEARDPPPPDPETINTAPPSAHGLAHDPPAGCTAPYGVSALATYLMASRGRCAVN
jgi:hypothetical protein